MRKSLTVVQRGTSQAAMGAATLHHEYEEELEISASENESDDEFVSRLSLTRKWDLNDDRGDPELDLSCADGFEVSHLSPVSKHKRFADVSDSQLQHYLIVVHELEDLIEGEVDSTNSAMSIAKPPMTLMKDENKRRTLGFSTCSKLLE